VNVLVTGCRGFVAGAVGRAYAAAGHTVLGVARTSQPDDGWPGRYLSADVAHADLAPAVAAFAPDVVFHGAGTASVGASLAAPLDDLRGAVMTWANVLDAVRRSGRSPLVVFPSSAAVYGDPATLPVAEDAPVAPVSPYGFHKAACELLGREYAQCFGLRVLVCRLFSLYGLRQRRLLVWELYRQFRGPDPEVWLDGTGEESRDYLHVDDAAAAVVALSTAAGASERPSTVNVAGGRETTVRELAAAVGHAARSGKAVRCRGTRRAGDPGRWEADVRRLRSAVPRWQAAPLAGGLGDCIAAWDAGAMGMPAARREGVL